VEPSSIRDRIPTIECSTLQLLRKQPWEMIESLTWHFSIFVGGNNRGDVKIGFLAS
jgi:hypothetical protein